MLSLLALSTPPSSLSTPAVPFEFPFTPSPSTSHTTRTPLNMVFGKLWALEEAFNLPEWADMSKVRDLVKAPPSSCLMFGPTFTVSSGSLHPRR